MSAFSRYLSLAPVQAVVIVSLALTAFILINWVSPNLLSLGQ
jgi:Photosystem I reaction centre subunit IX / PsaJ